MTFYEALDELREAVVRFVEAIRQPVLSILDGFLDWLASLIVIR